jgi:hypothetical protein
VFHGKIPQNTRNMKVITIWHALRMQIKDIGFSRMMAENMLHKRSRTSKNGFYSNFVVDLGLKTTHHKSLTFPNSTKFLTLGRSLWHNLNNKYVKKKGSNSRLEINIQ